jgi:hypothetical protein
MRSRFQVMVLFVALARVATIALQTRVDLPAVNEALLFARTATINERTEFNRPYRVVVGKAPVDYLDVITPYRRVVLAGTERRSAGSSLSQREALDLLSQSGDTVDISVELTFSPFNTYIGVPDCTVTLIAPDGRRVVSLETFRNARWTARLEGPPSATPGSNAPRPPGTTLLGATVVGRFLLMSLNAAGTYEVETVVRGEPGVRAPIALAGMR